MFYGDVYDCVHSHLVLVCVVPIARAYRLFSGVFIVEFKTQRHLLPGGLMDLKGKESM